MSNEVPFTFGTAFSISTSEGRPIINVVVSAGRVVSFRVTEHQAAELLKRLGTENSVSLTLELAGEKCMASAIQQAIQDLSLTRFAPSNKEGADAFIRSTIDDVIRVLSEGARGGF